MNITLPLIGIVLLLVASAFFSGSETALTAVSKARMHHLANEGSRRAGHVNALIAQRERFLGSVLLGNNFVNILASAMATSVALSIFAEGGVVIATLAMTATVLVFAEVLPKTFAIAQADRMALAVAPSLLVLVRILSPIVVTVQFVVARMLGAVSMSDAQANSALAAHEEIRGTIELHHREGAVGREHRHMLDGILDLHELHVSDTMVHRKNMVMVDAGSTIESTVKLMLSSGHTRFPVWKDDPENIVGILHMKDLLRVLSERHGVLDGLETMALATKPWFVPDTTTLDEQIRAFRERRTHFALVVDEYGTLEGLITFEDILEEIFGDIAETFDSLMPEDIRRQSDGSYNIDGWTPIREINRELDWNLPDDVATTIAGLVIHEARTIPEVGQIFLFHGFKFEVLRRHRNQITALRVIPPKLNPKIAGNNARA